MNFFYLVQYRANFNWTWASFKWGKGKPINLSWECQAQNRWKDPYVQWEAEETDADVEDKVCDIEEEKERCIGLASKSESNLNLNQKRDGVDEGRTTGKKAGFGVKVRSATCSHDRCSLLLTSRLCLLLQESQKQQLHQIDAFRYVISLFSHLFPYIYAEKNLDYLQ